MPKYDFNRPLHALTRDLPATHGRRLRRNLLFTALTLTIIGCLSLISGAHAAGGAYVVDDGSINAPGECTLDLWNKNLRHAGSSHDRVLSTACTTRDLPALQLGATWQHAHDQENGVYNLLAPQLKAQLLSRADLGLQLALAANATFAVDRGQIFDSTEWNLPLTYSPTKALRLNLNAGWMRANEQAQPNQRWTWGSGVEYDLGKPLTLIAERFGEGQSFGLRLNAQAAELHPQTRNADGSFQVAPIVFADTPGANDWYDVPKRTGQLHFTEP